MNYGVYIISLSFIYSFFSFFLYFFLSLIHFNLWSFAIFWRQKILMDAADNPSIILVCTKSGRLDEFRMLGIGLEECQKSLNGYLDSKRYIFPR